MENCPNYPNAELTVVFYIGSQWSVSRKIARIKQIAKLIVVPNKMGDELTEVLN